MGFLQVAVLFLAAMPPEKAASVDFWLELECRGAFPQLILKGAMEQREQLAAFLELRRRGEVPTFDVQWCTDHGIYPFRHDKEKDL